MEKKIFLNDTRPRIFVILEDLVQAAVCCAIGLFVALFFFSSRSTETKSMEPTIEPGSVVFTNRLSYLFEAPRRFDVVSFRRSDDKDSSDILVRRIIGLPGETIQISKGIVIIDGRELDISAFCSEITSDGIAENEIHLGQNEYFLLGDTPANSEDSRSSTIGSVAFKRILGKAWLAAGSLTEIKLIR